MHDTIAKALDVASLYIKGQDYGKAATILEQANKAAPNTPEVLNNLASTYSALGRIEDALTAARAAVRAREASLYDTLSKKTKTIRQDPKDLPDYLANLALLLERANQLPEAIEIGLRAATLRPDVKTFTNLGNCYQTARNFMESDCMYEAGLDIDPGNPGLLCNMGFNAFLQGDYEAGWKLYENRLQTYQPLIDYLATYGADKLYKGQPLKRKRLAVYCEQGYGDTLQFIRYLPLLLAKVKAPVTVVCQDGLADLLRLQTHLGDVTYTTTKPQYDYHVPLMSLPLHTREWCYDCAPYITVKQNHKASRSDSHKMQIGYCYRGRPEHTNDHNRSVSKDLFAPLTTMPNTSWRCLIPGEGLFSSTTWLETARIIRGLDLVITVDTAVIHLAAAMGVPTWGLIAYRPDPRWTVSGTTSRWYRSLRLFRQPAPNDWATVFEELHAALGKFCLAVC